jgi:hypothetical protein
LCNTLSKSKEYVIILTKKDLENKNKEYDESLWYDDIEDRLNKLENKNTNYNIDDLITFQ